MPLAKQMRQFPLHFPLADPCALEQIPLEEIDVSDLGGTDTVCQLDTTMARGAYGEAGGVLHMLGHCASQPFSQLQGNESCGPADSIPLEAGQDVVVSLYSLAPCGGCRWEGYLPYGEACLLPLLVHNRMLRVTLGGHDGVSFRFQCPSLSSLSRKLSAAERDNIRAVFGQDRCFVFFYELCLGCWSVLTQK